MSHPDDNLPQSPETRLDRLEILSTLTDAAFNRRAFLMGTAALLALPALAESQANQPQKARPAPPKVKPYLMAQLGHSSDVSSVAFSSDGRYVLTGSGDHTAILWEIQTGKEVRKFEGHANGVTSVAFSHDGRYVLTGSLDNTAILWEVQTGKQLQKLQDHAGLVSSVAFSPNGKYMLTGGLDHISILWEVPTGKQILKFEGDTDSVTSLAFSADSKNVLIGKDGSVTLWETQTGDPIRTFEGHNDQVTSVAFSPDGKFVLTGSRDKTARLWETQTGKQIRKFEGHADVVSSVAFSYDGRYVLTGSEDKTARLWETQTGKQIRKLEGHADVVSSVAFSADGRAVLTGSTDSTAILWETQTGKQIRKFAGHSPNVTSAAFSLDGRYVLAGSGNDTALLWETQTGKQIRKFEGHADAVSSVAFSYDGRYVLTGSEDKTARLWETQTGKQIFKFEGHSAKIRSVAFFPDGRYVLAGSDDNNAWLWEIQTGKEVRKFEGHADGVTSVAFSHDGRYVLAGSFDRTAMLWETQTGKQIQMFKGHVSIVWSVAFSPDDRYVLTGSGFLEKEFDFTARLWETQTGKEIRTFDGHTDWITSVAFSRNGRYILTGSKDKTALLWETQTGQQVRKFEGHAYYVTSVAFSPDDKYVLTGSVDSTTRLWETQTGRELCSLISFEDGTWAVTDREGRYDASNGGDVSGLHWVARNQAIDLKQLKRRYYVPGLMAKIFQGGKLADVAAFDNVPMYPEIMLPESLPANGKVAITLLNQDGGIGKVQILINGKEVQGDARGPKPNPNADKLTLSLDLAPYRALLLPGKSNTLEVIAYNGENWLASRGVKCEIRLPNEKPADKPRLYAIIGGINEYAAPELRLRFAAGDAESFAIALSLGAKRLFGVDRVEIVRLTGGNGGLPPTRANFAKAFAEARKLRAQDVFIVYLAGHGVALGKGADLYCYLTQEARAADSGTLSDLALRQKTTITSEELTDWIKQCPAHEQVMILDTCAAGAAATKLTEKRDVDGDQVRALDRLKDRTGFHILMGCAADRVSYEATRYGQGVLTYALLQGMKGAALGEGGQVDVSKLFQYAVDNVPRLAGEIGGIQRPQVCAPRADSFPVGRMEKEDQEKVPLEKTYPLILRPIMFNPEEAFDSLKLTPLVRGHLNDLMSALNRGKADAATVVYVDAEAMPGAITPNGSYTVVGEIVKVRLVLRQDEQTVETLTLEGPKRDPDALALHITRAIAEAAHRHGP